MPNDHSVAIIIPKNLALAKRIMKGDRIRMMTNPDGAIFLKKIEKVETK